MPSFDIISKVDMHEMSNAIDQANREIANRFDFRDADASFELQSEEIVLTAKTPFHLQQMITILEMKLAKRNIDVRSIKINDPQVSLHQAKQTVKIQQGIDQDIAKEITKFIKDSKAKVQASIQGDQVRVSGKKRDDLQEVIALLRQQKFAVPLQYDNFRD